MSSLRLSLAVALAFAVGGCNNNNNNGAAFPFERAEHISFACYAPLAGSETEFVTLPQHCCRVLDPGSNPLLGDGGVLRDENEAPVLAPECQFAAAAVSGAAGASLGTAQVGTPPLMHALVTQSTRGEVAAVDLVNDRVLDSDRLVPGYTFLDTGGLPSAIVVPPYQPRIVQTPGQPSVSAGPQWTYVASAEQFEVRAIASCRFRSGGACGPDSLPENQNAGYEQRTRVPMFAAPRDMLLGPGPSGPDQALWVSLPDRGLIARIELAETPTVVSANPGSASDAIPDVVVRSVDPFAVLGPITDPARALKEPYPYRVPIASPTLPPEPIAEASEYTAICGLNHAFAPAKRALPHAPLSAFSETVQPDRMHYDAESGLLLVTDRGAPVLHVFRFGEGGNLEPLPALPTRSIVREFVLTPRVPDNKPIDLLNPPLPEPSESETKRYLYAIDELGLLMVFEFALDAESGAPSLTPLLAPTPGTQFDDRIDVPGPVTAVEVIDTRTQSNWLCGEQQNNQEQNLVNIEAELRRLNALPRPHSALTINEIAKYTARREIYTNAASDYLRGVFLAVSSANGTLSIVDIHDLDVACRARKECCAATTCTGEADLWKARDTTQRDAVAVRRHAVRRAFVGQLETIVPNPTLIEPLVNGSCRADAGETFTPVDAQVCEPADPWTATADVWTVTYHGSIPNSQTTGAAFSALLPDELETAGAASTDYVGVTAPLGMNFCELGVQPLDLVAVLGNPPERLLSRCGKPSSDSASVYQIVKASADRLLVRYPRVPSDTPALAPESALREITEITTCYPDSVGIELRTGGFLVLGASGTYLPRTITAPDGTCIEDPKQDPLLTSRPTPADPADPKGRLLFKNPNVEFTLAANNATDQSLRDTSVQTQNGSSGLQVTSVPGSSSTADALPAALRYEPYMGSLFLLDTASQGLRRYLLQPFEYDTNSFR